MECIFSFHFGLIVYEAVFLFQLFQPENLWVFLIKSLFLHQPLMHFLEASSLVVAKQMLYALSQFHLMLVLLINILHYVAVLLV